MKILLTGAAGFIGFHLAQKLLGRGDEVVGLDNLNDYYDPKLKYGRLAKLGIPQSKIAPGKYVRSEKYPELQFVQLKLENQSGILQLFEREKFDRVCHLAAQAGVRYSITHPQSYINSNLVGFANILEACRQHDVEHLAYASSSSVYGLNESVPFSTAHGTNHPVSLYAATKKSNELMAHAYSHLYGIPVTGLRFFTVYGPWGRPDMAYYLFANKIIAGETIDIYNHGDMERDFTYIDDIVEGITRVLDRAPESGNLQWTATQPNPAVSPAPYRVYNIGNSKPVNLLRFVEILEEKLNKKAIKNFMPMQPGDVKTTWADVDDLISDFDYQPQTSLETGIEKFVEWYKAFYNVETLSPA